MPSSRASRSSALAVAALAALICLAATGCFDGTVRDPPSEGRRTAGAGGNGADPGTRTRRGGAGGAAAAVKIAAVGDTTLGTTPILPPDPADYLDAVSSELTGDAVFGNLEGTLTDVAASPKCGEDSENCFAFRAPPEYAEYLAAAGFTVMSTANNHSYDFGSAGEAETKAALRRAGIAQTGSPGQVTVVEAGGLEVAFVGFSTYSNTAPLNDPETVRALVRRARSSADLVVVSFHGGAEGTGSRHVPGAHEEYLGEDRGDVEAFAHLAVEAGADLVLGSGPHVLRGMEIYRGRLIAYSLGNFSGYQNFSLTGPLGVSAVLHVTLAADGSFRAGRIASLRLVEDGRPVPDPDEAAAAEVAELSRQDFGRRGVTVGEAGRIGGATG
ncbi:MAG: CapA family protein [Solirubrobacterales bacterium]